MSTSPNLGLPYIASQQAQPEVTHNEALHILDSIVQLAVLDQDLTAPPGSPAEGDRYIVAASATGAWAGHDGEIAAYVDAAWSFYAPGVGWIAFVADEAALYVWNGTAWAAVTTGGGSITALQNLTLLGIGATADATNPLSAKLNKALWTAKTAAEGGDGDLRYTMNKETAGDTVSLLLQKGFSGRAEFGLIGDDNLTVKVSPDGSAWTTAIVIDRTTGAVAVKTGQIGFPATQNPSSDPNTLDDYEEGTFTPTLVSSGGGAPAYGDQVGFYTKVGNRVSFELRITLTSLGTLAAGNLTIDGLPFTSESSTGRVCAVAFQGNHLQATATTMTTAAILAGATAVNLSIFSAGAVSNLTQAMLNSNAVFNVAGTYGTA